MKLPLISTQTHWKKRLSLRNSHSGKANSFIFRFSCNKAFKKFDSWISGLIKIGKERTIKFPDLYTPVTDDQTEILTGQLERLKNAS